ncbi:MAG: MarR family transcriptional regulator [Eubacteriales bacterium]|nr:MarR family transcriptional regulator [Eubacteriales bacterium]
MDALYFMAVGRKILGVYSALCAPVCKKHGINGTCLDVLMFFHNYPEYNTARDLCQVRGIKSGLASVAVDTLLQRGLLIRRDDTSDRRVIRLLITPVAADIIRDGIALQQRFEKAVGRGISARDRQTLLRIMSRVQCNLTELEKGKCKQ